MDLNELNEWIDTEEGRQWLDEHKAPLLRKRDELLSAQASLRDQLAAATQRSTDAETLLETERSVFRESLIESKVKDFLSRDVVPANKEAAKAALQTLLQDAEVTADGTLREIRVPTEGKRLTVMEGEESEEIPESVDLDGFLKRWSVGEGKVYVKAPGNSGAGAIGKGSPAMDSSDSFRDQLLRHMKR